MQEHTPFFREPAIENAGKVFEVIFGPYSFRYPNPAALARMVRVCAYPDCGVDRMYRNTPLCITHAEVVWKLFEEREPDLHKIDVRQQYKDFEARQAAEKKQKADETRVNRYRPGEVYYIRVGNRIKIGFTTNLYRRITQYPPNAELLASHPGTKALEKDMHLRFDMYLEEGREWFSPGPKLMEHIADVAAKYPNNRHMPKMRKANKLPAPRKQVFAGKI